MTTTNVDAIAATSPRKRIGLTSPSGVDVRHGLFKNDLQIRSINISNKSSDDKEDKTKNNNDKPLLILMPVDSEEVSSDKICNKWFASDEVEIFLNQVTFLMKNNCRFWIDIDFSCLSENNFEKLCNILNLHETTMRDCLIEDKTVTDTKIVQLDTYLFCIVDTLQNVGNNNNNNNNNNNKKQQKNNNNKKYKEWETKNMNVILYNKNEENNKLNVGGVVTMHNGPIDGPDELYSRIVNGHKGNIPSSEWVVWAVFDVLTESLIPRIDLTDTAVFEIEKVSVPTDLNDQSVDQSAILHQIKISRRRLGQLKRSLSSKLELLYNLTTTYKDVHTKSMIVHLKALEAEVKWKTERVISAQENLQSAYQNYLAFVSLQATAASNSANAVLKKITVLLALTTPLNLIASIFGMNVYPLNQVSFAPTSDDNYLLFIVLLFVMLLSSLILLFVAKGNKWL